MKTVFVGILISAWSSMAYGVSLDQAFQEALKKHESVKQSQEQTKQAENRMDQARSAVFPTIALNASHLIQPQLADPLARSFFPANQTTVMLSATQPLFRGFREFAFLRQQENLLVAQKKNQILTLVGLYESVATSFLGVLSVEQDLRNLTEQKEIYGARIKELVVRARRGESSASETLTAQATEAALDAEIQLDRANLKVRREQFSFLTGLPWEAVLEEKPETKSLQSLDSYLSRIEERPDIQSARERASAAQEQISIAKGNHWPTLDAMGNYYFVRPPGILESIKWDAQLKFSLPIFEGGLRNAQVQEASSKYREAELELNRLRREATTNIRALHETLRTRNEQLSALKRASDLSGKNYEFLQRDSRRGLSRNIDVQLALTEFRASRRAYHQVRYAGQLDMIKLETTSAIYPDALLKEVTQ